MGGVGQLSASSLVSSDQGLYRLLGNGLQISCQFYVISAIISQIEMNRVQELIVQALTTANNNQLRQQAENTIFNLLKQNPTEFFLTCARIVGDENKQQKIRQSAASVMKAVLTKRNEYNELFWDIANPKVRPQIKEILLANLVSPNILVMRAGANVIAQIAAIEIVRNQWPEIINALAQNSMHPEINIRRASITTLGFICEELKFAETSIPHDSCEQILGSLLLGMQETGDIVQISLNALRESISFLRNTLENINCCNKVFQYIFPLLNTDHSQKIYEILFQIGKYCYHLLGNYINAIVQFTTNHIRQRNQNAKYALELWDTIGTEYSRRTKECNQRISPENISVHNYVRELHEILLPEVMGCILILQKSDLDFPDLREGAVKTLGTFVNCSGREVVDKVAEGVSRVIASGNPGERQATVLLFSCLCEFEDKEYIEGLFCNGFQHLYQLIDDNELIVRKNALNGFLTLSQQFPNVFINNHNLVKIFDHLLALSNSHDEDIQILSLSILTNITDQFKQSATNPILKQPDVFLQSLIQSFTNNIGLNKNKESNEKIIVVIMNIVMKTSKRNVLLMLIAHLISKYHEYSKTRINDKQIVHEQVMAVIHTAVLSLSKFSVDEDLKRKIYHLIDLHTQNYGVEQQGINMISAAAICFKKQFLQEQFDKYWSIVTHGLEMIEQKLIFKAALACISDIARTHEQKIVHKLKPVFTKLISYIHNNIDRQLKTQILKCFGDLSLGLKSSGSIFVEPLISISNECFEAVYKLSEIQSEKEYAQQLKESLIEMYHCVLFAENEQNKINERMANHFGEVCTFIVRTCDTRLKPTIDYLKLCLYVIFDSALFYSKHPQFKATSNNIIKSSEVNNLIMIMQKYKNRPQVSDVLVYIQDKLRNQRF